VKQHLLGFDRDNGRRLWSYKTDQSVAASTPTAVNGIIYFSSGNPRFVAALRPGGGELEPPATIWRTDGVGSGIASPLIYEGHVYIVDRSVAVCLDAGTGQIVAKTRLTPSDATFYASPVAAGKTLFAVSRESGVYTLSTAPDFKQLAHNTLDDGSVFNGTPAVHGGELLLRSDRYLYCIGEGQAQKQ
ncbi:MAG: PQQ-binding-like beta-propeller repeat protein, partial [Pirellulales bacterium]